MLKQIEINHYRGIQQLTIEDWAQINIFVGYNDGRIRVLEVAAQYKHAVQFGFDIR